MAVTGLSHWWQQRVPGRGGQRVREYLIHRVLQDNVGVSQVRRDLIDINNRNPGFTAPVNIRDYHQILDDERMSRLTEHWGGRRHG